MPLQSVRSYIIFGLNVKVMTICTIIHLHTAIQETLPERFVNAGQETHRRGGELGLQPTNEVARSISYDRDGVGFHRSIANGSGRIPTTPAQQPTPTVWRKIRKTFPNLVSCDIFSFQKQMRSPGVCVVTRGSSHGTNTRTRLKFVLPAYFIFLYGDSIFISEDHLRLALAWILRGGFRKNKQKQINNGNEIMKLVRH